MAVDRSLAAPDALGTEVVAAGDVFLMPQEKILIVVVLDEAEDVGPGCFRLGDVPGDGLALVEGGDSGSLGGEHGLHLGLVAGEGVSIA